MYIIGNENILRTSPETNSDDTNNKVESHESVEESEAFIN